ncbi:MAG TPA: hypothetical protein VM223_16515 [Planctomycetota bacterium]|nr:hypothetical protein [Planctomycetota bacterium]
MAEEKTQATTHRGREWEVFSECVFEHIAGYTVPQYGDAPDDQATDFTFEDCIKHIQRYATRAGKVHSARQVADLMKIAHCACIAWAKLM